MRRGNPHDHGVIQPKPAILFTLHKLDISFYISLFIQLPYKTIICGQITKYLKIKIGGK